jgi:ABC-type sugar transport system substrate-binding protein
LSGKTLFVLLIGTKERGETNDYQLLQEEAAVGAAKRAQMQVEIAFAPGFDHLRVLRKRLSDGGARARVDAVVTEPPSLTTMDLVLKELQGKAGLVLMNSWGPGVEQHSRSWGAEHPFGTVSTDHVKIGEIQGRQVAKLLPGGGNALCITGPLRSSPAQERLAGARAVLPSNVVLSDTEAGQWTEPDGIAAFHAWYRTFRARKETIQVVAAHNDELAMGARSAAKALPEAAHREMFLAARYLGVDACPGFGKRLVDEGDLSASIMTPATTGMAIELLTAFWQEGRPLPLRSFTTASPYPPGSI